MSTLAGLLGIQDINTTLDSAGRALVLDNVLAITAIQEEEVRRLVSTFVQTPDTSNYQEMYYLTGGGMMQPRNRNGVPDAVKITGNNSVGYDLEDWGDALGWDDVTLAYMSVQQMDANIRNIAERYTNLVRWNVLRHLFNSTNRTFVDERWGSITVKRLANGDADVYSPVLGSTSGATENHYLESGYLSAAISDTNNPYTTIVSELEEHFGEGNKVAFINPAERVVTEALTDFVPVNQRNIAPGTTADQVIGSPGAVPGRALGSIGGVWVVEWRWIPANYILALDLDQPAPLKRRVDIPQELRGFKLVGELDKWPITVNYWRVREGYGAANRLNGVVLELGTGGTYTTPTLYA